MKFIDEKVKAICRKLKELQETELCAIEDVKYCETDYKKTGVFPDPAEMKEYSPYILLDGESKHYWFYAKIEPQKSVEGKQLLFATEFDEDGDCNCNPQCIVYLNGKMVQSLDSMHNRLELEFETEYELYIHFYTGNTSKKVALDTNLVLLDEKIEQLYYDLSVPLDAAMCFDEENENRITILKSLEQALALLDMRVPLSKEFYASIDDVRDYLYKNFYNGVCGGSKQSVSCIGHAHIDVEWLWVLEQTIEKAQRTFATAVSLMKKYPEYKFIASQPQLYQYVKDDAPELYDEIKELVKKGRWEAEGALWVEADTVMTSGESLIRQIMYGKRFMKEEFGADNKCVWLPDSFGYSAALPQILKKCGIDYFVTSKISWNEFDKMPYDSFMWQGIDGSEIFTYFMTAQDYEGGESCENLTTYNGFINPKHILGSWKRYQQKPYNDNIMVSFGYGDGGGGPTKDMLEQQRRLSFGIPGIPKTKIEFAKTFLDNAYKSFCKNSETMQRMPRWVGELYFELHRGTLTSVGKVKRNNRKCEFLLQTAEKLSVIEGALLNDAYDQKLFDRWWKILLLHQFHDALPGSSIHEVYERCDTDYAMIKREGGELVESKLSRIADNLDTEGGILVFNPNGFECTDVVEVDGKRMLVENIPPCGYKVVSSKIEESRVIIEDKAIENSFYRIEFNDSFEITSLYDKKNEREVVKAGELFNELQLFEDYPKNYDAWEISIYHKQKRWSVTDVSSIETICEGARCGIKITRNCLNSKIIQTIYLYDDLRRIDFDTFIDWKEEHLLLKAAFPVNVHANEATYDIQFGNIKRPTHQNTSWDKAKFEVCGHKWADISDAGYGLSVLNDCKYGYSAEGSTIKLSLLKCATFPNPYADKEEHHFTYSLLPHTGDFREAETARVAYMLNQPLYAVSVPKQDGVLKDEFSFVSSSAENIMIETVKKAETSEAVIVRVYEYFDCRTKADLVFARPIKRAFLCDMLENEVTQLEVKGNKVPVEIANFEVLTIKVEF